MKAVRFHDFGGPEVLRHEDVEPPVPGVGQVRIRVAATSFNGLDVTLRAGDLRDRSPLRLPHTPGLDVAGTVDALGPGVDEISIGDRVVGLLPMTAPGAAAQHVLAPAQVLAGVPRRLPLADLAALPLVGLTAWQALFDHGGLMAGQRVLINGVGGAVGGYVVQLAVETGAQVLVTATPSSAVRVKAAGSDEGTVHTLDHTLNHVLVDVAHAVVEPVDLVLNLAPIGAEQLAAMVPLIRDGGRLVSTTAWMPIPCDEERGVQGVNLSVRSDADQLADLVARVSTGELLVNVAERVALADLPALHARAHAGALPLGKVVVLVPPA
ncbi:alcohol dehydrogenase catalytic domain-containing protein [Kineococcus sp. T13]|uniref:NADP-dependent oxidoreductase n=1 Tax=Kineococcus vitellinus TaxID=2696565 RepID=UPI001412E46D|nr:NADP-dependent oxidoreductase [Kineococcus vitellinus]NAZ76843.1 alcohol dehydrogenase catalytic domain-containing protein [Kineococcus vitellinus]